MKVLVERLNSDEEFDPHLSESMKIPDPTMNFQVDETLFE